MTKNIITLALAGALLALSTASVNARTTDNIFNQYPAFPDHE